MITFDNEKDMIDFGEKLSHLMFGGFILTLDGDLGAGKTTFTKFFAAALGIKDVVNSPTFNIIKCYFNKNMNLYHIDAYRLEGIEDDIGLDEYIYGDGVCVIEWGKFIMNIIPSSNLTMDIRRVDENVREVEFSGNETLIKEVIEAWQEC